MRGLYVRVRGATCQVAPWRDHSDDSWSVLAQLFSVCARRLRDDLSKSIYAFGALKRWGGAFSDSLWMAAEFLSDPGGARSLPAQRAHMRALLRSSRREKRPRTSSGAFVQQPCSNAESLLRY